MTPNEKALARLNKWRKKRVRLHEMRTVTGISMPYLSQLLTGYRVMTDTAAQAILSAKEPAI